jgi:ABC-type Co2+ transport system permease subunit
MISIARAPVIVAQPLLLPSVGGSSGTTTGPAAVGGAWWIWAAVAGSTVLTLSV